MLACSRRSIALAASFVTSLSFAVASAELQAGDAASASHDSASALLKHLDQNGDGTLSKSEIENAVAAINGLDLDKDGQVSIGELIIAAKSKQPADSAGPKSLFERIDRDADGFIAENEIAGNMKAMFTLADANADKRVSRDEFVSIGGDLSPGAPNVAGQFGRPGFMPGGSMAGGPKAGGPMMNGEPMSPEMFIRGMDRDRNGEISRDEARGPLETAFDKIDQNSDGVLNREELTTARNRMAGQRPKK